MIACRQCGAKKLETLVDFGAQPVTNRFLPAADAPEYRHSIVLGQCPDCALLQLLDSPPARELVPIYDWITYNEPEPHLDALADQLMRLGLEKGARTLGVSFKDESLLARLERRGCAKGRVLDMQGDLGITTTGAGVEAVQDQLTPQKAAELAARHGRARLVVARQILEHSFDLPGFLESLIRLAAADGLIIIEIPDCAGSFDKSDCCAIWEEHVVYFSEPTYRACLAQAGLELVHFQRAPYPMEDSLVAVARATGRPGATLSASTRNAELARGRRFAAGIAARERALRETLAEFGKDGPVALLGAGHLSCAFLNFQKLEGLISFVADDHPKKKGLFMPGSRLPILPSEALLEKGVKFCLLGVNPNSENAVLERQRAFLERGGRIASIFPASPRALKTGGVETR